MDGSCRRMKTGLDLLEPGMLPGPSVALLSHYAAVDRKYRSAATVLREMDGVELKMLLGPQHGFRGETQDNMIEWESYIHPGYGIPVLSLYGSTREPDPSVFRGLDCLVVDLQDVGSRYYTYIYTMAYCLRSCNAAGVPVVILDRPNPVGLEVVEGRPLDPDYRSFVGLYRLPVRHGLTIGESAGLFASVDSLERPVVVKLEGWDGSALPDDYQWVHPSPNMPTPETALVYVGMCLLEGTNLSEGRGTTKPFHIFGAPWLDGEVMAEKLNDSPWMEGAVLRPHAFIPTFNKHCGELCDGCEIHVVDAGRFRPLRAAFGILLEAFRFPETRWREPPYEYEYRLMPIDILAGGSCVRKAVSAGDAGTLMELSRGDPVEHSAAAGDILLYERKFRV